MVQHIEKMGVQTRMLFAGNLVKHPCFDEMRKNGEGFRVVGSLEHTDRILKDTFWVGVYPGMTDEMIDYMAKTIREAIALTGTEVEDSMAQTYDMTKVHEANLKILKELDRICRKYKIRYALDAGTLIGAVRHKGFIPWDDDADVVLIRSQYEALKRL